MCETIDSSMYGKEGNMEHSGLGLLNMACLGVEMYKFLNV